MSLEEIIARVHLILPKLLLGRAHYIFDFGPEGLPLAMQSGPGLQPPLLRSPGLHIDGAPPVN